MSSRCFSAPGRVLELFHTSGPSWTVALVSLCRPVAELVRDIREGNWLRFGPGKLRELCKLLPEGSEVTTFQLSYHFLPMMPPTINITGNSPLDGAFSHLQNGTTNSALSLPNELIQLNIPKVSVISRRASPQVKRLLTFSGKLCVLPEADQFMVQLVKVPG